MIEGWTDLALVLGEIVIELHDLNTSLDFHNLVYLSIYEMYRCQSLDNFRAHLKLVVSKVSKCNGG